MNWSEKNKIALISLFVGCFTVYGVLSYVYKQHETIEEQEAEFIGQAIVFAEEVIAKPEQWNNTIIILEGLTTAVEKKGLMLNGNIYCQYKEGVEIDEILVNQKLKIKGRFIGYDDLLEEIKLDQSIILSQE